MRTRIRHLPVLLLCSCCGTALADYKADIGYTRLLEEQGANTPDGSGVRVTQAEAETGTAAVYMPDAADPQFTGKIITDVTGMNPAVSGHATGVGRLFYGNSSSITPAIDTVNAYSAGYWLGGNYLLATYNSYKPRVTTDRVANHSWIGNDPDNTVDLDVVKRVDWVVEQDEFIQAVGVKNNTSTNSPLLSAAFNVIAVGASDGVHGRSTVVLEAPYVAGRARPELVAPFSATSSSTPVIAAAAALLVGVGHERPWLSINPSTTSTTNRSGNVIYNAERSEVVKAVLMAGADRVTDNTTNPDPATPANITDYRADPANRSTNGLDVRYGAGQLNIYNSYHMLAAGEQNSAEDAGSGAVGPYGFDYDPSFGGAGRRGGSNMTGSYTFSTGTSPVMLTATLAWNVDVADGSLNSFPGAATLHDLDLRLYEQTSSTPVLVATSASTIDNTENIWIQLDAGRDYRLEVTPKAGQSLFEWDYALAWQILASIDTDSDGVPDDVDRDDDNDGLLDADESAYETDPLLADTDGDGFEDGMEVAYGSSPVLDTDMPADNHINNGDINNDGRVDIVDVLLATRIVLEQYIPSELEKVRADMVPDNQVNAGDLLRIQQLALGL